MERIFNAPWELVEKENLNPDSNGEVWGELYRYPIYSGVNGGETVTDGFNQQHTAPADDGVYTLYQYVQDACLMGFRWVREGTKRPKYMLRVVGAGTDLYYNDLHVAMDCQDRYRRVGTMALLMGYDDKTGDYTIGL